MNHVYRYIGFQTKEICKWFDISYATTLNYLKIFNIDRTIVKQYGEAYFWVLVKMPIVCFELLNKKNNFESYEKFMDYLAYIMYEKADVYNSKITARSEKNKVYRKPKLLDLNEYFEENIPNTFSNSQESITNALKLLNIDKNE